MLRIAAFADVSGVSAKTLRAWDELRLFRPAFVDPESRYRYYSPAQLPELRRIVALRDLGVPLADIARLVAHRADLRPVLERRRAALERERVEVERRLHALEISVALAGADPEAATDAPDVVVRPLEAELVATLPWPAHGDVAATFAELEVAVRDAGIRAGRPPGALTGGGRRETWEMLVPVSRRRALPGGSAMRELPAVRVASAIHRGTYDGLVPLHRRLARWVSSTGLVATGARRIRYLQFGAEPELRIPAGYVVDDDAAFVTELQLELA